MTAMASGAAAALAGLEPGTYTIAAVLLPGELAENPEDEAAMEEMMSRIRVTSTVVTIGEADQRVSATLRFEA